MGASYEHTHTCYSEHFREMVNSMLLGDSNARPDIHEVRSRFACAALSKADAGQVIRRTDEVIEKVKAAAAEAS